MKIIRYLFAFFMLALLHNTGYAQQFLESLRGADAVIYLDFDGHVTPAGTLWNNGNEIQSAPSTLNADQMREVWEQVSEDFRPFKINVTNLESVYLAANEYRRMRVVISPTRFFDAMMHNGVGHLSSFKDVERMKPCFVFIQDAAQAGTSASHEVGHTMGLWHDGNASNEYYYGQGNWGPIMGKGEGRRLIQWSKGEYLNANNPEDDLKTITLINKIDYQTDEDLNTLASARNLNIDSYSNIIYNYNRGIITMNTDVDYFKFTVTVPSTLDFTVLPNYLHPNLNIRADILNANGNIVYTSDPAGIESAPVKANVSAGTYYLAIDGAGEGDPAGTGFSDYGSLGYYTIAGKIQNCVTAYEPNESFTAAAVIQPNTAITANTPSATDIDWYKFTVPAGGELNVDLTNIVTDMNMELYDNLGNLIITASKFASFNRYLEYPVAQGTYYIKVWSTGTPAGVPSCYELKTALLPSNSCPAFNEPNDQIPVAKVFQFDQTIQGAITTSSDVDIYMLIFPYGGSISLKMTDLIYDYDLTLMDSTGRELASSVKGGNFDEEIIFNVNAPRTLYLKVFGYRGKYSRRCYKLISKVTFPCTNNFEPNQTLQQAAPLALNTTVDVATPWPDYDYYSFNYTSAGNVAYRIVNNPNSLGCGITLYGPDGRYITSARNDVSSLTNEVVLNYKIPAAGIYKISATGSLYCYSLSNTFTPVPNREDINSSENTDSGCQVYPSPFDKEFIVKLPDGNKYEIQVLNAAGQSVYRFSDASVMHTINQELIPGIYLVRITGDNFEKVIKVVKQ
jgi:hypothetical protein